MTIGPIARFAGIVRMKVPPPTKPTPCLFDHGNPNEIGLVVRDFPSTLPRNPSPSPPFTITFPFATTWKRTSVPA